MPMSYFQGIYDDAMIVWPDREVAALQSLTACFSAIILCWHRMIGYACMEKTVEDRHTCRLAMIIWPYSVVATLQILTVCFTAMLVLFGASEAGVLREVDSLHLHQGKEVHCSYFHKLCLKRAFGM